MAEAVSDQTTGEILSVALRMSRDALYPAPWSVEVRPGTRRARVLDFYGNQIINGMNIEKAQIIVAAVNGYAAAMPALEKLLFWNKGIKAGAGNYHVDDHIQVAAEAMAKANEATVS
jgi:hypothetical protein